MKKLIAMLVVGGFLTAGVIGFGPGTTSEEVKPIKPGTQGTTTAPKTEMTSGKVVDWTKPTLKVKPDTGDEKTFTVPADVTVSDDVKKDAMVSVTTTDGKVSKVEKK